MAKKKILIVEDEYIVARDIKDMLENLGYSVPHVVSKGEAAIEKAAEKKPDLVIMDILLKGDMDGISAAEKIRNLFNIPVVYLTAYSDKDTLKRAKITEPFGYLLKPLEEKDLLTTIETSLYKHKMETILREREKWLSTVLSSIGDAVIATDENKCITFMNPVAEMLTGWQAGDASGKDLNKVFNVNKKESNVRSKKPITGGIWDNNISLANQVVLVQNKGTKIPIDYRKSPVKDDKGSRIGNVLVFRDITQQREVEQELRQSYEKLYKTMKGSIRAISLTVEMRDPYTAGHQRRVSQIACDIAREMDLAKDQIDGIQTAALIHDIGKIHVPAEILSKPSQLTEAELILVKAHPQIGYEILESLEFPWPIDKIVLQHHEKIDGSGYPSGLSEENILIEAKILCVSDVVEAMSSHRPYRPTLGIDRALEEIKKNKGILYDQRVVDACVKIFSKKKIKIN